MEAAELKVINLNKVKGKMEHTLDEVSKICLIKEFVVVCLGAELLYNSLCLNGTLYVRGSFTSKV